MSHKSKTEISRENAVCSYFRMDCSAQNILESLNFIMSQFGDSCYYISKHSSNIQEIYFTQTCAQDDWYCSLTEMMGENLIAPYRLGSKRKRITQDAFFSKAKFSPQKTGICIILFVDPKIEFITQLQYISLVVRYLKSREIRCRVILKMTSADPNTSDSDNKKLYEDNYYRIRTAFSISYYNDSDFISDIFWFFNPIKKTIRRVFSKISDVEKELKYSGKIFPILNIDEKQYDTLCKRCKLNNCNINADSIIDEFEKILLNWCRNESQKFEEMIDKDLKDLIIGFMNKDNYLDAIIFLYICYAIIDGYDVKKAKKYDIKVNLLNKERLTNLHEICINISQGVIQLLENIYLHVIKSKKNLGCGTLCMRLYREDEISNLNEKSIDYNEYKYRLYIYINDLQFRDFSNIVEKFIENNESFPKEGNLKLKDFFQGNNLMLEQYLNQTSQIAMHYGLQIFDCVVSECEGKLFVSSGNESYSNNEIPIGHSFNYSGTAYEIEFLIENLNQSPISFSDIIFPISEEENEFKHILKVSINDDILMPEREKAKRIKCLNHLLNSETLLYYENNKAIVECLVIDLLGVSDIRSYEIIAKSLFLYLSKDDNEVDYIALVNLSSSEDVIKLFRQFALFYSRKDLSPFSRDKKIFIIDEQGISDVLICGKNLHDVINLVSYERLYGGIDTQTLRIINNINNVQ